MPDGTDHDASDPAETILTAVNRARSSTLLRLRRLDDAALHADPSEGLPLMSAFARIEDPGVRTMITRVVEMLAAVRRR